MSRITLLRRVFILLLAVALPAGSIGLLVAGMRGWVYAELLTGLLILGVTLRSERAILKVYRASTGSPRSVRRSLDRVMSSIGGVAPSIHVSNDLSTRVLVVRSPGSDGSILLSEGLLGILSEDELRRVLSICVQRLRMRGIVFQSFCAWSAHLFMELAPRAWRELLVGTLRKHPSLSPTGAVRCLAAFSMAKFFVRLGRSPVKNAILSEIPLGYVRLSAVAGEVTNPGAGILHVVDPWASHSLFPL